MTANRAQKHGEHKGLLRWAFVTAAAVCMHGMASQGAEPEPARGASPQARMNYRARKMLDRGLELLEAKQEERAVKLIASVPRMFPKADVRFKACLILGEHYLRKGQYDIAIRQFHEVRESGDDEEKANALYSTGICYYRLNEFDKAFMSLRQVTSDYPGSVYANEAYYYIGQCHFKLGRWAKAVEALRMVGTSVELDAKGQVLGEAGQRLFVKIHDKDLIVLAKLSRQLKVELAAASGDRENILLSPLGKDREYYIGSIETLAGKPVGGDGKLQIIGGDVVTAEYVDENTQAGERNRKVLARIQMVSTAVVGFTDGAFREYTQGVFGDSDCFLRVKDMDRDTTDRKDVVSVKIHTRYKVRPAEGAEVPQADAAAGEPAEEWRTRDTVSVKLVESAPHAGIFVGHLIPRVTRDPSAVNHTDGVLSAMKDDQIVCSYLDERHIHGAEPREVKAVAKMLIGQIQDVKIEHRVVDSVELKARKNLIEAKIFLKLGTIFKDVGLSAKASEKADLGLERVEEVIRSGLKASLDRQIVEEAFSVKWELLLVQDKLSQAIGVCQSLTRLFPDSRLVDRALLKIGLAKMRGEKPSEAIGIFAGILRLRKSDLKADAQYHIAMVLEQLAVERAQKRRDDKPDFTRAMLAYKKCADTYPTSPYAGKALEKIATYYIQTDDNARAVALMERVFQDYPDAVFLDRMLYTWAQALFRMGRLAPAKEKCDLLLRDYPGSELGQKARDLRQKIMKKLAP